MESLLSWAEDLDFSYTGEYNSAERGKINRKFETAMESVGKQYIINRNEHRGRRENEESLVIEKMSRRSEKFERNKLMEKIQIASSPMKWNSELSLELNICIDMKR